MTPSIIIHKGSDGSPRITAHIEAGSRRNFMLMEKDNITMKFTAEHPEILHLGDYIEIENIGRYELTTPAKGEFDTDTGGFKYEIQLDAQYWKFKNKLCKFLPQIGSNETSWNYTDTLPNHAQQILFNLRSLAYDRHDDGSETLKPGGRAYLYNGTDDWLIQWDDTIDTTKAVTIEYDGRNIVDAIGAIAEAYECEWWFEGKILWFGKCEFGDTPIALEMGKEITAISRYTSQEEYVTRLFVYGSDRNLASNYRKTLVFIASNEGGKIHDPERPLDAAWFKDGTVTKTAKAAPRQAESFNITQNKTVNSYKAPQIGVPARSVILEKSIQITDPEVLDNHDFTALFSEITCRLRIIDGKTGIYKAQGLVEITYPEGTFDDNYQCFSTDTESIILNQSAEISVRLNDLVVKAKAKPKSIRVSYSVWLEANEGTGVSRTLSCTIYGSLAIKAAPLYEEWRVTGVTVEVLDKTTGEVERTIDGAIFNANLDGDNKLTLPEGQTMPDGTKYRLPQINNAIVPARYFTSIYTIFEKYQDITTNGIVNKRLLLPDTTKGYIDVFPFESEEEAVEGVVVFEDIYPSRISKITSITRSDEYSDKQEEQDGSITETKWRAFQFQDDLFNAENPFNKDYLLDGKDLQVTFQSGLLNGMTFDVAWMNEENCFEIQRDDTTLLPNEYIRPQIGDEFILHGFNVAMLSDANTDYIAKAEQELLRKGQEYAEKLNTDTNTYECTIAADVAYRTEEQTPDSLFLTIGRKVKLIHPSYFAEGRISRVIGYEVPLDYAYDNPVYFIGEKTKYSRLEAIEKSIEGIGYQSGNFGAVLGGNGSTGAGGGQYVITTEDPTPPTDRNLYSALRSRIEFALKTMRQNIEWLWTFLKGIRIGNYVKGYAGAAIDEAGNAEFESIESRSWLKVQELIYNRLNALEGDTSFSDIGTIEDISSNEDGTQTAYLRMRWEGDFTAFQPGDVVYGYVNNLDNAEKKEWYKAWAWISEVDRQTNTITLVAYPDSEVPAKKNFPMASGMVITRWGNNIEPNQQTFVNPDYSAVIAKRGEGDYVNVRQSSFFISCEDGNLVELLGVRKPILEAGNYGTVLGKIPPGLLDDKTEELINKDQPYLYARGIIVQDLIRIGYEGVQTRTANYRGVWSREDANDPLRYYRSTAEVYDTVTWNGSLWQCLVQGTTDEPQKNCQGWLQMTAGPEEGETIHIWQIIPNANIISVRLKEVRPEKVTCSVVRNSSDNTTRTFNDSYELSLEGVTLYYSLDGITWKEFSIGTEEPIDLEDDTGYIELETPEGSDTYLTIDGDDIATSEIGDRIMFQLRDIKTNAVLSQAEVPVVKDGISGAFKSRVFRRTNTIPNEAPKGGTYENPIPDGDEWSDGIPQGAEILWSSVCTFYADGRSSGWSQPAQETDTATLDIEFSPSQGEPPAPQGNTPFSNHESEGWFDPNSKNFADKTMIWRAERKVSNGVYDGEWTITRIYGETGKTGDWTSYAFKQSTDRPNTPEDANVTIPAGWQDAPTGTGRWWMTKALIDGATQKPIIPTGATQMWSTPVQCTAEDGVNGNYTDFKYNKQPGNSIPTSPKQMAQGSERNPTGWVDDPPTLSAGEVLWMITAEIDHNNKVVGTWSDPTRISGEKGDQGEPGSNGLIAYPAGEFSGYTTYTSKGETTPVVLYNGNYYCLKPNRTWEGTTTNTPLEYYNPAHDIANSTDPSWILFDKFQAVFTEILFAEFAKLASGVFFGEWLISQHGQDGRTDYQNFKENGGTFIPNFAVNLLTGELQANSGTFRGDIYADHGVFSGLVKKAPTIITPQNFAQFCTVEGNGGSEYFTIDWEKCGTYISLEGSGSFEGFNIELPSIYHTNSSFTREELELRRQYIGVTIIIYNRSSTEIGITGATQPEGRQEDGKAAPSSFILRAGECAALTCHLTNHYTDATGYEQTIWEYRYKAKIIK